MSKPKKQGKPKEHRDDEKIVKVTYMSGVEGPSLYIDGFRVAGPKPWGGGTVIKEWDVGVNDIRRAIKASRRSAS